MIRKNLYDRISYLLLIGYLLLPQALDGQNNESLKQYVEKYKTCNALIKEKVTIVNFAYKKNTQTISVNKEVILQVLSLRANNPVTFGIYFDDNSEITYVKTPGKKFNEVCGNYRPEWIFHSDDKLCTYTFSLDELGQTQAFLYNKFFDDVRFHTTEFFSEKYPVLKSIIRFIVPDDLDVEFKDYNTEEYAFKFGKKHNQVDRNTTYEYQCENLPGYDKTESNTPDNTFVFPHVLIIPKTYQNKNEEVRLFATLNDFYLWNKGMADKTSKDVTSVKPLVSKLTNGKINDVDRIKAIYYWVQENIRYIAFEEGLAGYIPESADKVYLQKYGDCKGMANLLKTMLNIAGYDSRLCWIGTSNVRYDFSNPTLASCNHMLCVLILNGKHYFLDATDSYVPFGESSVRLKGRQALIEDGKQYILETVPSSEDGEDVVECSYYFNISGESLNGDATLTFKGAPKYSLLYHLNNNSWEDRQKSLEKILKKEKSEVAATNISTSDIKNREDALIIKGQLFINGSITQFDNEMYILPDPFEDILELLTEDGRQNPLKLEKKNKKTEIIIPLPDNYELSKKPENFGLTNDLIHFQVNYVVEGRYLKYIKQIRISEKIVPRKKLQDWNAALKQIRKAWSQPFVLKKV